MILPVGRGGGLRGANFVNKHFVNKLAFPSVAVLVAQIARYNCDVRCDSNRTPSNR